MRIVDMFETLPPSTSAIVVAKALDSLAGEDKGQIIKSKYFPEV
jgi:hypothetical protein